MDMWSVYQDRIAAHGGSKKDASMAREVRFLNSRLSDSLSHHIVEICTQEYGYNIESNTMKPHRIKQDVMIINSDNLNEKTIISMPSEDIELGSLVLWMNEKWLVTERDANTTVYTRAKMIQCNHLLKWVADDGQIIEQWCVFDDGTKLKRGITARNSLVYWKQCA